MTGRKDNQYGQRWSIMRVFNIPDATDPSVTYLKRLRIVQTPWFGVYLHWIYLPDRDRDPHDHPWPFASFVVRGGYVEHVYATRDKGYTRTHRRFSLHRMPMHLAHGISSLEPNTVTLLVVGRRQREWGFWTPGGFVEWKQYGRAGDGPDPFMGSAS